MRNATKRLLAFVLAAAMILSLAPAYTQAAGNENLALGRPTAVSNVEAGTSFTGDKAVDGMLSTRWATDMNVNNPWIEVDLDDGTVLKQINIVFERSDANQNILGYKLEAEVDGTYQTIYTHEGGRAKQREKIILADAVTADKLKLTVTNYDDGQNPAWRSVSVCEIEVYSNEFKSLSDIAAGLNDLAGTVVDGDTFVMPEAPAGTTIEMNGADLEQIIGKDGSIQKPLVDKTVNVAFQVSDGTNTTVTADIPVIVKGQYEQPMEGNAKPQVIPEIQEWYSDSIYKLPASELLFVTYDDAALESVVAEFISDYAAFTGRTLKASQGEAKANAFNFSLKAPDEKLGEEGYTMKIDYDRIDVASVSVTGNMYGMQTILQMAKLDAAGFPVGQMRDYPRFQVRGLLLDMARKPVAMTMVGEIGRTMRYYKMNDLHLHLNDNYIWLEEYGTYATEDEGFKAYEAFRLESSLTNEAGEDPTAEDYFVTKEEMRTFIQTQRALGMNVIPEIDVPAHAMSFTKVWPELSVENEFRGHTLIDHFNLSLPESVAKIKAIFDDYTKAAGDVPATFDSETIIHVGADEYYLSGTIYREYFNDIVPYIKQTNPVRIWGSLTQMNDNNQTKIIPEAIENVQMNIWNTGWANPQDMFDLGFDLINTIDGSSYMVPNGNGNRGGYGDYLNLSYLFSSFDANRMGNANLPSGDDQVLGAAFAIWNDNIDRKASGLTESDVFDRFFDALPIFAEKTWAATGKEKGSISALTELSKTVGVAPNTNPYFQVESTGDTHASYDFAAMADISGNGRDLIAGTATVADGVLTLNGGNSYISTPINKIGNGNSLSFDITLTKEAAPGQILFETTPEYYTHDIRIMEDGTLGFTRELYDYSFGYTLPVGETVHIEIVAEQQQTTLYVNGVLAGAATGKFVHNGMEKKTGITHSTFALPLERIGSETNAIAAVIDNILVVEIPNPADDSRDIPVEALTATAGDEEPNGGANEGPAHLVLDGNPGSLWHTNWKGTSRDNHWIQLEVDGDYLVDGLRYLPRESGSNGVITEYDIQVSEDGVNFRSVATGEWANNKSWKVVGFEPMQVKYVRLVALNAVSDNSYVFASAAEIRLTGEEVNAHEHEYVAVVTAPTCTEGGYTTYTCSCGDSYIADETAALGHTEEIIPGKAATCTETGLTEGKKCSVCNEILVEQEEIPALGHDFVNGECSRCDAVLESDFEDVAAGAFYFDPVKWAVDNKITAGTTPTTFDPNGQCMRAVVVTFLWKAAGSPEPTITENPFTDVKESAYYYKAVLWAYENKITSGLTETTFGPTALCNRAQVVTFLYNAMGKPEVNSTEHKFTDVSEGKFYYQAMLWAVENNITAGLTATTFGPNATCNRAQVVTFLYRAYK